VATIHLSSKVSITGTKNYAHHSLPTGARPMPVNPEGKRVVNGWEFHYEKWNSPDQASDTPNFKSQSGATSTNPFPDNRKGRLDYELLKKMKLTKSGLLKETLCSSSNCYCRSETQRNWVLRTIRVYPTTARLNAGRRSMIPQLVWAGCMVIPLRKPWLRTITL
jgi:hypothetical protein